MVVATVLVVAFVAVVAAAVVVAVIVVVAASAAVVVVLRSVLHFCIAIILSLSVTYSSLLPLGSLLIRT